MEGRDTGQNLHPRSFYDIMNPHGHNSSSLHAPYLSHEGMQYPMSTPHGIQHMYPFGGRWSGFSMGNSSSSSEVSPSSSAPIQSKPTKHISSSHSLPTPTASTESSQSWWSSQPMYPGMPSSDMHPFSSMPWTSQHEHHEPLSSSRESHSSQYHGAAHLRMSNGLLPSSRHSQPYHRSPHGSSQFQSGTLIHFPHTSSHQSSSSPGDLLVHSMPSSAPDAATQYHKDKPEHIVQDDPMLSGASEGKDRSLSRNSLPGSSTGLFKEKDLLSEETEKIRMKQVMQPVDKDNLLVFESPGSKKKCTRESELMSDRSSRVISHSIPQMMTSAWKGDRESKQLLSEHDSSVSKYPGYLQMSGEDSAKIAKVSSPMEDSLSKRRDEEKSFLSFSNPALSEAERVKHSHSTASHNAPYCRIADKHWSKHEPYHVQAASQATSPPQRQSTVSNLHSDRLSRAQATQEWVNQNPGMYRTSPERLFKPDESRGKYADHDAKSSSQFERKPDFLPSPGKMTDVRSSGRVDKAAGKREHHYESPLNSTLPRYTGISKVSQPESIPIMHSKHNHQQEKLNAPRFPQQNKNPFNVDFLSVSADSEKKQPEQAGDHHASFTQDYMKPSDRVSVIKSMPTIAGLKKDIADPLISEHAMKGQTGRGELFVDAVSGATARTKKPASFLNNPLPPKKQSRHVVMPRDLQASNQVETSSTKSSNIGSSSSSDEDSDEDDDNEDGAHGIRNEQNGTDNDESEDDTGEASENGSQGEDSTASGSESDDNDTQSHSTHDQEPYDNSSLPESTPEKRKGGFQQPREPKRRKIVDENLIRVPMENGWKRQIRIRPAGNVDSIRGDVYYFAPCGKKIRTYPEVTKYLGKHCITDLTLDNFSFSTKTTVGEFLEAKQGSKFEILSEEEVLRRHSLEKERLQQRFQSISKKREKKKMKNEISKRTQEAKTRRKLEKQAAIEEARLRKQKNLKAIADQKRRKKESEKQHKEMERLQKQEQMRMEKEMRARSIQQEKLHKQERTRMEKEMRQRALHEARRSKKEALQHAKMEEAMRKARERELKRQQTVILKQQEKERRKQHLMMIRALESQRKAEERERRKEEKRLEKRLLKQRKMEQRKYERSIARELKKPVDDMVINDGKPLPEYERVKGVNIPGRAYADLLMVEEFVYCFGHVLDIDPESDFPKMSDLQAALLSESSNDDALFTACESLLSVALHDPGVSAKTKLGVSLQNLELSEANISEVLRLFILATNNEKPHELADLLTDNPIHSLSPVNKAAILAFLVNEILCSDKIYNEMENCLEHMSNLRRDKWNMEGRIRKFKADLKSKKAEEDTQKEPEDKPTANKQSLAKILAKKTADETEPTTVDEIEKRINRLEKKHSKYRHKLFTASHTLRGLCLGQDRYKRRYHILPHAGGVYIEGMESGELPEVPPQENNDNEKDKQRKRSASGSYVSDSKTTPTDDNKELSLALPSPIAVPSDIGNALIKSPTLRSPALVPAIKSPSMVSNAVNIVFDREHLRESSGEKAGLLSPSQKPGMLSPTAFKQGAPMENWFSLFPKKACDETSLTRSSIVMPSVNKGRQIVAPNVRLLSQDRHFMESLSARPGTFEHLGMPGHGTGRIDASSMHQGQGESKMLSKKELALFAGFDIQKLIEQDPQKAAILLDMQKLEPAPVPKEMCYGWWRVSDADMIHKLLKLLNTRGIREKMLHKGLTRHTDYACSSCKKEKEAFHLESQDEEELKETENMKSPKKENQKCSVSLSPGEIEDKPYPQVAFSIDKDLLVEVEELEEKMFSASLQNKSWRLSQKDSSNVSYIKKESKPKCDKKPLELAKARILSLERGIERRYLKPPFRLEKHPNQTHVSKSNVDTSQANVDGQPQSSDKDWRITPSLLLWRETVDGCTSSAQLSMCISMLKECIAWERSIMKVFCIECRKGDNEELLLLCDQCDRGCHTYCCNPKLEKIPDGDWFCRECIMMASGSDQCYGCQGSTGRRLKCEFCPRYYHMQCVDPPLHKTPRSPWACPVCKKARQKSKRPTKRRKKPEDEFETLSAFERAEPPSAKVSRSKKEKMNNRKQAMEHMAPCKQMLADLERHECSWPFLVPVNGKQFPEYYQIIKSPMDFHTMKVKLRDFQYNSREEFASDARLVFRNCDIFNEDESQVGQAGKRMLRYFEKRWVEVLKNETKNKKQEHDRYSINTGDTITAYKDKPATV
eukprot:gene3185-3656_t